MVRCQPGEKQHGQIKEIKDVNSIPGYDVKPQYVNRFHVVCDPSHVRIIMGDVVATGANPTMHSAVLMTTADAKQLADLLLKLIEQSGLLQQEGKPNILYN